MKSPQVPIQSQGNRIKTFLAQGRVVSTPKASILAFCDSILAFCDSVLAFCDSVLTKSDKMAVVRLVFVEPDFGAVALIQSKRIPIR
ncbi:MAG: hypothetical protein LBB90_09025, partial [Tannerella sp.]|nr:hypothetical protein [Tannerella sp.]